MIIPGKVGYMTILPDHATMVSELAVGELQFKKPIEMLKNYFIWWLSKD